MYGTNGTGMSRETHPSVSKFQYYILQNVVLTVKISFRTAMFKYSIHDEGY